MVQLNIKNQQRSLYRSGKQSLGDWLKSGEPMIWANAAAVSISLIAVLGLIFLLAVRGFGHFWPADILSATVSYQGQSRPVMGEVVEQVEVSGKQLRDAGIELSGVGPFYQPRRFDS